MMMVDHEEVAKFLIDLLARDAKLSPEKLRAAAVERWPELPEGTIEKGMALTMAHVMAAVMRFEDRQWRAPANRRLWI